MIDGVELEGLEFQPTKNGKPINTLEGADGAYWAGYDYDTDGNAYARAGTYDHFTINGVSYDSYEHPVITEGALYNHFVYGLPVHSTMKYDYRITSAGSSPSSSSLYESTTNTESYTYDSAGGGSLKYSTTTIIKTGLTGVGNHTVTFTGLGNQTPSGIETFLSGTLYEGNTVRGTMQSMSYGEAAKWAYPVEAIQPCDWFWTLPIGEGIQGLGKMIYNGIRAGATTLTASTGGRIFWVGNGAESLALELSSQTGYKTIYNTWYGKLGNAVSPYMTQSQTRMMWGQFSKIYANGVKVGDDVITVFGRHHETGLHTLPINSKAVWKTIEFLYCNLKVLITLQFSQDEKIDRQKSP